MKWLHLMIIALISVSALSAAVISVPEDAATIQAGINVANDGDTVLVSPGTYVENINFNGQNITVKSLYGPENTTIDGDQNGSVVLMLTGEAEEAVLDGFTITNGTGWNNGDEFVGGGIVCRSGSSPTLRNLIITGNTALGSDDPAGGGITIAIDSHPSLENIIISNNESVWGGGLAIAYDSNPTLKHVEIHHNDASTTGGGVYIGVNASPYFEDVYVHDNHATYYGGGFFLHDHATPTFNKVTVRGNRAPSGGGGLITNHGSRPNIVNSIFYGNIPDQIIYNSDSQYLPDTVMIAYSNIQGGQARINVGPGLLHWETGNVSIDPCFTGVGDELQASSPCINSGTAVFAFEGVTLVDMTTDEYVGPAPDMGSYEVPPPPTVYNVPGQFNTIQAAIDAAVDGDIVSVAVGTYVENINYNGKNITVESLGGPALTIIDANQNGPGVTMTSGETEEAVLDGFTITNGTGWYSEINNDYIGGGVCVRFNSSPILKNLIVSGNSTDVGEDPAGGGIAIGGYSNAVLENIVIHGNSSVWGGGLSIYESSPTVINVEIYSNTVSQAGGGVYIGENSRPYFESVYVHDNIAVAGGGFFLHDHVEPIFNKITVEGNRGTNGGGGMLTNHASNPKIVNSIFYGNIPDQFYLMYDDGENLPDTVSIAYSNIIDGVAGMHLGFGLVNWITGNMQSNPRLGNGDHLGAISPCIDAGTASFAFEGETWINMATDEYVGDAPDMGSWEMPAPQALLVPQNFATIQLGIEAALDGDTVLVADGTYYENINFLGKNIMVKSVNGEEVTTIDGGGVSATVLFMNQEASATLDGFTITNGTGFYNVSGYHVGGGITVRYASTPTLKNLIIENNNALGDTSMGGGIMCAYASDAIIEDVIIRDNESDYGGGFVAYESNPSLTRVKIYANVARTTGGGAAFWNSNSQLEQVAIYKNEALYVGGGVWVHKGGNPTLDRVTIAYNKTTANSGAQGGGIAISDGSNLTLQSSIVWRNTNRGIIANNIEFWHLDTPNGITILYSDVQGGEAAIVTNDNGTISWAANNIVDDPLFVDVSVDNYNLQTGSPCIGTGMLGVDMGAGSECMTLEVDPALVIVPQQFELYQNYPNPFNPSTTINFELPGTGWVELVIYDLMGREVTTLIDDQRLGGRYSMNWLAQNHQGKPLGTGIYLYEMKFTDSQGQHFREVRKFTLLK